ALRLRKWQRAQEHGVDDGENGDVCADTQSQGQQRDRGESRALQQGAHSVARILQGLFDPRNGPLVATQFCGLLDAGSATEDVLQLCEKASHGSPLFLGFAFASRGGAQRIHRATLREICRGILFPEGGSEECYQRWCYIQPVVTGRW